MLGGFFINIQNSTFFASLGAKILYKKDKTIPLESSNFCYFKIRLRIIGVCFRKLLFLE